MSTRSSEFRSGKSHKDENFPVASWLIDARHRGIILAFYNFVRTADDIADHPTLGEQEKLALLDRLDNGLQGHGDDDPEAVALRAALSERAMPPRDARDLLTAFRMDVTKRRYKSWDELIHYCSYSAMPVGRFVLDVHGESQSTWQASDALCAALQIINHLQDCGDDYRNLDRVYVPLDILASAGATVGDLGQDCASPALRQCLHSVARRTGGLLNESAELSPRVKNFRLSIEIAVIQSLARRLVGMLTTRDPLSERVHLGAGASALTATAGIIGGCARRIVSRVSPSQRSHDA